MAEWPNHFVPGKQFQKRSHLADLAFDKDKWQPWSTDNEVTHFSIIFNPTLLFLAFFSSEPAT